MSSYYITPTRPASVIRADAMLQQYGVRLTVNPRNMGLMVATPTTDIPQYIFRRNAPVMTTRVLWHSDLITVSARKNGPAGIVLIIDRHAPRSDYNAPHLHSSWSMAERGATQKSGWSVGADVLPPIELPSSLPLETARQARQRLHGRGAADVISINDRAVRARLGLTY